MLELPLAHYRFHFRALEAVRLPDFAGSAWRGAFGNSLRRLLCATRLSHCDSCPLVGTCAFPYLFEGRRPPHATVLSGFERVCVPYALRPGNRGRIELAEGAAAVLDMALFGRANDRLVYIVHALQAAALQGIGPGRGRLELKRAHRLAGLGETEGEAVFAQGTFQQPGPASPPKLRFGEAAALAIRLESPLRLKSAGKLVTPEALTAPHFIEACIRRISALAAFHAPAPIEADYARLKTLAALVSLGRGDLRWLDWKRFSRRQGQRMAIGGIIGDFVLELPEEARELLPWIELAQWAGVGKSASMGLGQFRILSGGEAES